MSWRFSSLGFSFLPVPSRAVLSCRAFFLLSPLLVPSLPSGVQSRGGMLACSIVALMRGSHAAHCARCPPRRVVAAALHAAACGGCVARTRGALSTTATHLQCACTRPLRHAAPQMRLERMAEDSKIHRELTKTLRTKVHKEEAATKKMRENRAKCVTPGQRPDGGGQLLVQSWLCAMRGSRRPALRSDEEGGGVLISPS